MHEKTKDVCDETKTKLDGLKKKKIEEKQNYRIFIHINQIELMKLFEFKINENG